MTAIRYAFAAAVLIVGSANAAFIAAAIYVANHGGGELLGVAVNAFAR